MAISEHEHRQMDAERAVIAARVCDFAESLPDRTDIAAARLEGEQICEILEPLGLPEALVAAVRLYPLCREGLIGSKELQKLKIEGMPELVQGLVQLGRFSLPPDWQPGEALAVQQSEALRKMLLAVVSDARLVVVRIAEELYRLRLAKRAPVAEQRALAIETQEIYRNTGDLCAVVEPPGRVAVQMGAGGPGISLSRAGNLQTHCENTEPEAR
jgi:GTP pyrophosphokinase